MEALNQSENNSTEDEEVIDPITITVNTGVSLSAPESQCFDSTKIDICTKSLEVTFHNFKLFLSTILRF